MSRSPRRFTVDGDHFIHVILQMSKVCWPICATAAVGEDAHGRQYRVARRHGGLQAKLEPSGLTPMILISGRRYFT